jgi:uncharacterized Zn finger protein (UPF0148 family)
MPLGKSTCRQCNGEFQPWGFIFCPKCGDTPFHEKYPERKPHIIEHVRDEKIAREPNKSWQIPEEVRNMKW